MAKRVYPWDLSNLAQDLRADILANPKETPRIECKRWLDLNDSRHKAVIAKAAIALANSGGGVIVFGVVEDETQAKHFNCVPRPDGMKRYTADAVASAITNMLNRLWISDSNSRIILNHGMNTLSLSFLAEYSSLFSRKSS